VTAHYLELAIILALTLNRGNRVIRAGGTLLAAIGLAFIMWASAGVGPWRAPGRSGADRSEQRKNGAAAFCY
jgi:uncharacterized protein (DUF2062 family)